MFLIIWNGILNDTILYIFCYGRITAILIDVIMHHCHSLILFSFPIFANPISLIYESESNYHIFHDYIEFCNWDIEPYWITIIYNIIFDNIARPIANGTILPGLPDFKLTFIFVVLPGYMSA